MLAVALEDANVLIGCMVVVVAVVRVLVAMEERKEREGASEAI